MLGGLITESKGTIPIIPSTEFLAIAILITRVFVVDL